MSLLPGCTNSPQPTHRDSGHELSNKKLTINLNSAKATVELHEDSSNTIGCADLVFGAKVDALENLYFIGEIEGKDFSTDKKCEIGFNDPRLKGLHLILSKQNVLNNLCSDVIINPKAKSVKYNIIAGKLNIFKQSSGNGDVIYKITAVDLVFHSRGRKDIRIDKIFYFRTNKSIAG
jgi:hypothetical protein